MPEPVVADRDQSRPEELANSLSHGLGLLAALAATAQARPSDPHGLQSQTANIVVCR